MESKELAYKALDELEANLGNWNQGTWDRCFAAFVCRANGDAVWDDDFVDSDGLIGYQVGIRAAELLGITVPMVDFGFSEEPDPSEIKLFGENNQLKDIRFIISGLFGER